MANSRTRMFYANKRIKIFSVLSVILVGAIFVIALALENEWGVALLFALELIAASVVGVVFTTKLEVSDSGIKYSNWALTTSTNWEAVEKITDKGLLARSPEITFRRWAELGAWRSPQYLFRGDSIRWAPESVRTIHLRIFERNWPNGQLGEELQKYIPDFINRQ